MSEEEDHRKHLEFIQAVITRQATNQFLIKGWALTVAAVIFGYAARQHDWPVALLGIAVMLGFAGLDAYFLRQERAFRCLWADALKNDGTVATFSLDMSSYRPQVKWLWHFKPGTPAASSVIKSPPLLLLYGVLAIVGVVVLIAA